MLLRMVLIFRESVGPESLGNHERVASDQIDRNLAPDKGMSTCCFALSRSQESTWVGRRRFNLAGHGACEVEMPEIRRSGGSQLLAADQGTYCLWAVTVRSPGPPFPYKYRLSFLVVLLSSLSFTPSQPRKFSAYCKTKGVQPQHFSTSLQPQQTTTKTTTCASP